MSKSNIAKLIALITAIAIVLILILVGVFALGKKSPADQQPEQTEAHTPEIQTPVETEETEPSEEPETTETEPTETEVNETLPEETLSPKPPSGGNQTGNTPPSTQPGSSQKPTEEPDRSIRFPYAIPDTNLVIEQVNSYNGIFFEDGSDRVVANVAAIVLTNKGDSCVEYVNITMKCGDIQLQFTGSTLDAGARMIVLETDSKSLPNGKYTDCTAEIASVTQLVLSEEQVRVEEQENGSLLITNLTEAEIPCIRIFYKYYMDDVDVYVGGITYTAKVVDLEAGESCTVTPSHYYSGFSKILMVKTYETKD